MKGIGLYIALIILTCGASTAQHSVLGKWKTIDENTGEVRSMVEIFERNNKVHGRIVQIFPKPGDDPDPVCDECDKDDPRYMKKIMGMEIIKDLTKSDDEFSGGTVLDPEVGRIYRCKIWLEGDDLMIRGYWGPFFRTQTWKRVL